ncbi:qri8-e2 ubiquitin-conjugating enzyme [Moesziomyces antarcticus]|nr:qri8-e2 ubiquitin-conjugating enzyme [Moesziomyces antarcticus]GAK62332.1 qri8-e2 ubiquitin-conjugating enzyme [Moesziomyces antarcticus]
MAMRRAVAAQGRADEAMGGEGEEEGEALQLASLAQQGAAPSRAESAQTHGWLMQTMQTARKSPLSLLELAWACSHRATLPDPLASSCIDCIQPSFADGGARRALRLGGSESGQRHSGPNNTEKWRMTPFEKRPAGSPDHAARSFPTELNPPLLLWLALPMTAWSGAAVMRQAADRQPSATPLRTGLEESNARAPKPKKCDSPAATAIMFNSRASSSAAIKRLTIEYKQLSTDPNSLFPAVGPVSEDNYLEWEALVPGPDGTPFEGGVFSARLTFPASYPLEPPTMRFEPPIFHPNVYADGLVCISILHAPGDDPNMYESSSERWSPVQSIEKILLSVLSMLAEPNVESGANIDACKMYRDNREGYEKIIRDSVKEQLGL